MAKEAKETDDRVQYSVELQPDGNWRSVRQVFKAGPRQRCRHHEHNSRHQAVACMNEREEADDLRPLR
ncbi:MAG: hypothetical protein WD556_11470 [Actinomycetota bacterium]